MAFSRKETARLVGVDEKTLAVWAADGILRPSDGSFYSFTDLVGLRALAKMREHKVQRASLLAAIGSLGGDQAIWSSKKFVVLSGQIHVFKGSRLERPDTGQQAEPRVVVRPKELRDEMTKIVRFERTRQPETFGRIVRTRGVCGGRPRFDGTRLEVSTIQRAIVENWPEKDIFRNYPSLTREDFEVARADLPVGRKRPARTG